ncbi:LytR/AlgR family response regulator transcription factor [Clostridium sp.]|uniref:LytR/AlgR family response regulator transcription factor n=1 Tax=Clostridium sp. TaxID=1506 RepID=UPI003F3E65FC
MILSVAICEDEMFHRKVLANNISKILDKKEIRYKLLEYGSGEELFKDESNKVDILFLDICLDGISGMEVARTIRESNSRIKVIFTTCMKEYVFEAYEVNAYRYLVKPIEYELLEKYLLDCAYEILNRNNRVVIKCKNDVFVLDLDEILYVEVIRKHVTIYTDQKNYTIEISLKKIQEYLKDCKFFRCHHSYIVNLEKVEQIKSNNILVIKEYEIYVSRSNIKELQLRLASILGEMLCK